MEVEQVLHMNGGVGKTSYANNSLLQVTLSLSSPSCVDFISSTLKEHGLFSNYFANQNYAIFMLS